MNNKVLVLSAVIIGILLVSSALALGLWLPSLSNDNSSVKPTPTPTENPSPTSPTTEPTVSPEPTPTPIPNTLKYTNVTLYYGQFIAFPSWYGCPNGPFILDYGPPYAIINGTSYLGVWWSFGDVNPDRNYLPVVQNAIYAALDSFEIEINEVHKDYLNVSLRPAVMLRPSDWTNLTLTAGNGVNYKSPLSNSTFDLFLQPHVMDYYLVSNGPYLTGLWGMQIPRVEIFNLVGSTYRFLELEIKLLEAHPDNITIAVRAMPYPENPAPLP